MNFQHIMFTNYILLSSVCIHQVLKSGTLSGCKQNNTSRSSISVTIFRVVIWDTFLQCMVCYVNVVAILNFSQIIGHLHFGTSAQLIDRGHENLLIFEEFYYANIW